MVLKELEKLGIKNIKYLARGKRSVVYTGNYKNKKIAIKAKKDGISAKSVIKNEVKFLKILNRHRIGPKLIYPSKEFFVYKFVRGKEIFDYFKTAKIDKILKIIREVLRQCYVLDELGINKKELHHPVKHILIYKNKPVMIDFERCYYAKKPKNVTQFCQFLLSGEMSEILNKKYIKIDRDKLIKLLKIYKKNQTKSNFIRIIKLI